MQPTKLILTGGPSGGKTALAQTILKEFGERTAIVPEVASMLFRAGFPRGGSVEAQHCQQRAIYYVQCELEEALRISYPDRLLVCDRGTLDGAAYWPGGRDEFLFSVGTVLDFEWKRYDWVIHLETAGAGQYDHNNPIRLETPEQASSLDQKIQSVWSGHPRRFVIRNSRSFLHKVETSLELVRLILDGRDMQWLRDYFVGEDKGVQIA